MLVAPGDRTDASFAGDAAWLPATLGEHGGLRREAQAVAHPAPRTFTGPVLPPFAQGDAPALAEADLFAYRVLEPAPASSVLGAGSTPATPGSSRRRAARAASSCSPAGRSTPKGAPCR